MINTTVNNFGHLVFLIDHNVIVVQVYDYDWNYIASVRGGPTNVGSWTLYNNISVMTLELKEILLKHNITQYDGLYDPYGKDKHWILQYLLYKNNMSLSIRWVPFDE